MCKFLCLDFWRGQAAVDETVDAFVDDCSGEVAVLDEGQRSLEALQLGGDIPVRDEVFDEVDKL